MTSDQTKPTCPPCTGNCDQGRDCDVWYELSAGDTVMYWGVVIIAAVVFVAITAAVFG